MDYCNQDTCYSVKETLFRIGEEGGHVGEVAMIGSQWVNWC